MVLRNRLKSFCGPIWRVNLIHFLELLPGDMVSSLTLFLLLPLWTVSSPSRLVENWIDFRNTAESLPVAFSPV